MLCSDHGVSEKLQELLNLHRNATDVVERRLISKTIWRMCRKERRKKAVEMAASAVESRRAPGSLLDGISNHLNWSIVFGAQAVVADRVIADFFC